MSRPSNPNLRDALVEAGKAEFAERGLEHARIEDITRRAGASKGAFYLHFVSKESLFEVIAGAFVARVLDQLRCNQEAICGPGGEFRPELIGQAIDADVDTMRLLWEERGTFHMLMEGGTPHHLHAREMLVGGLFAYFSATACAGPAGFEPQIGSDSFALFVTGAILMQIWRMTRQNVLPDFRRSAWDMHRLMAGGLFRPEVSAKLLAALEHHRPAGETATKASTP